MFYVYKYLREDGTPYYVGKGSGIRAYKKWSKKEIKPPADTNRIIIVEQDLTEDYAFNFIYAKYNTQYIYYQWTAS
jgi:hypothetical protein